VEVRAQIARCTNGPLPHCPGPGPGPGHLFSVALISEMLPPFPSLPFTFPPLIHYLLSSLKMTAASSGMIPEIAVMIGTSLDRATISSCTLVCKSWYATFVPQLYHHVDYTISLAWYIRTLEHENMSENIENDFQQLEKGINSTNTEEPWQYGLQRHGCHIRNLAISEQREFPNPDRFGVECRHLTVLDLNLNSPLTSQLSSVSRRHLIELVDRNPNIHTLKIRGRQAVEQYLLDGGLLRGQHLPALKTLILNMGSRLSPELLREILNYGSGLEQMTCFKVDELDSDQSLATTITNDNNNTHQEPWHQLRRLSLYHIPGKWIEEFIKLSPNLERLELRPSSNSDWYAILAQLFVHTRPKSSSSRPTFKLQHLCLDGVEDEAAFSELCKILKGYSSLPPSMESTPTGLRTFQMHEVPSEVISVLCEVHAETLEEVGINRCDSKSVRRLLTSCPKLRYFEIRSEVLMEDLLEEEEEQVEEGQEREAGRWRMVPWACQDLEVLKVDFAQRYERVLYPSTTASLTPSQEEIAEKHMHQQLWTQIGKMKQLRNLHVYTSYLQEDYSARCLLISNGGVDELVGLKKLRKLKFCGCQYHLFKDHVTLLQRLMPTLRQEMVTLTWTDVMNE